MPRVNRCLHLFFLAVLLVLLASGCTPKGGAAAAPESAKSYAGLREESRVEQTPSEHEGELPLTGPLSAGGEPSPPAPPVHPDPGSLLTASGAPPPPAWLQSQMAQAAPAGADGAGESIAGPSLPETTSDVPTAPKAVAAPLLIYTADLVMGVFETAASIDQVEKLARDAGGYLVERSDKSITVRVPAARFNETLERTMKLGDVLRRDVKVKDVTEQYYDLQVRLRNAEAVLARLATLLEKAATVKDALAVEAELSRVAGQVESLKGRLKLLRELIAFSTITVQFQGRPVEQIDTQVRLPFPWLSELGLGSLLRF